MTRNIVQIITQVSYINRYIEMTIVGKEQVIAMFFVKIIFWAVYDDNSTCLAELLALLCLDILLPNGVSIYRLLICLMYVSRALL